MMAKIAVLFSFLFLLSAAVFADENSAGYLLPKIGAKHYLIKAPTNEGLVLNSSGCLILKNGLTVIDSFVLDNKADLQKYGLDTLSAVLAAEKSGGTIQAMKERGVWADKFSFLPKVAQKSDTLFGEKHSSTFLFYEKETPGNYKISWLAIVIVFLLIISAYSAKELFLSRMKDKIEPIAAYTGLAVLISLFVTTSIFLLIVVMAWCFIFVIASLVALSNYQNKTITKMFAILCFISQALAVAILWAFFGWRFGSLVAVSCLAGYLTGWLHKPEPVDTLPHFEH